VRTKASVLVGRAAELETALLGLKQSIDFGDGPAYFCIGEAGAGKSRLLAEVASVAFETDRIVASGRASCMGAVSPLRPFAEALAGIQRRGLLPAEQLGGYRALLARVLPQLSGGDHLGIGEGVPPIVAFAEAVLRVLILVGSDNGCLLVLEDLHDFDPESLAVLEYLLDNLAGTPVALLGALRDEPSGARDLLAAAERSGTAELLPIRPLGLQHTGMLIAACLGTDRPPPEVTELVWRNSVGNPLVVEELLYEMLDSNQLSKDGTEWRLAANPVLSPPSSMLQLVGSRIERLGDIAGRMLISASVYGEQFPLAVVLSATGDNELDLLYAIQAASAAQLLSVADLPGWYRFRHPLIHSAVLELAGPAERRHAAAALATATLAQDPELSGETCRAAARLLTEAGQHAAAGDLYARAGREALRRGAIEWAVADLGEAIRLLTPGGRPPPDLVSEFVIALFFAGQLDRALELVDQLNPTTDGRDRQRRALTHIDLAWGCYLVGRIGQADVQLAAARSLVTDADTLVPVHCDVIAACLEVDRPRSSSDASARLALAAAEAAERGGLAVAACRAWHAYGRLKRESDLDEANRSFERIITLADQHRLPSWELFGRVGVAGNRWLVEGDDMALQAIRDEAQRSGTVSIMLAVEGHIWLHQVLIGNGSLARAVTGLASCVEQARRLGYTGMVHYGLAGLAVAAAHRADRAGLADALARFEAAGGGQSAEATLASGLGVAFGLALEGRDAEALSTLQDVSRRQPGSPYCLSGRQGLGLLLAAVTAVGEPAEVAAMLDSCYGQMRWNRQFLHWAAAVHAGRQGQRDRADWHAAQAARDAERFPTARHLAARLVGPAAAADGWGDPVAQLRAAEAWFYEQGISAAARGCRDILRSIGAPVQQRRDGSTEIPAPLRTAGVTIREYQVGLLVREHLGNRAIGDRLHISPRTVEKHVAALLTKLSAPDRSTLIDRLAAEHRSGPPQVSDAIWSLP
jgi:DNA-binding CsgD family transcriptional regulator/tetratricopeptide (TPR) repeat protein